MKLRWRRERVPDEVKQAIAMERGEQMLSVCASDGETYLAASDRALYRVDPPEVERLRWDTVDRAVWEPPHLHLRVRDDNGTVTSRVWQADQTGDLPAVVRERVTGSILVNSQVEVRGGTARVLARRNSDTGAVEWRVVFGAGVDPQDPLVRSTAEAELADLRSRLGV